MSSEPLESQRIRPLMQPRQLSPWTPFAGLHVSAVYAVPLMRPRAVIAHGTSELTAIIRVINDLL